MRFERLEQVGTRMLRWSGAAVVGVVACLATPTAASAHAGLLEPPPRTTESLIPGPCGSGEVTGPRTVFAPGETISVQWEQFIPHYGIYRIAFSPNDDAGFDDNVLDMVDEEDKQLYELSVTLPMCTCDDCTLQLYQTPGSGGYYSCADIELRATDQLPAPPCPMASVEEDEGTTTGVPDEPPGNDDSGSGESDGGDPAPSGSSTNGDSAGSEGASSGCRVGPRGPSAPWLLLPLALLASLTRRHPHRAAGSMMYRG